ncbi:MAG: tRNA (adenosine(37)-N6)-threonylcarbamoyltransferase complex dimerization subunit type 1 TsaB [Pseudomonadota bacterium]|nr:tRNA (adenosine(37)-N6)-threonylcarbamoyltransferase complex dimerization subunit type 1 TsaB [Pseudomonadota bacterium]
MNVLAVDTSLRACSAAVRRDDGEIFAAFRAMERGHAEALMPMIADVVARSGLGWPQLKRIAVTTGPGTFTGVRIGIAAARGLALATGAALFAQTSLAVLAAGAIARRDSRADAMLALSDARRGECYAQVFRGDARPLSDARLLPLAKAVSLLPEGTRSVVLCGSAAHALAESASDALPAIAAIDDREPEAAALAMMAAGAGWTSLDAKPLYLRPPDARPQPGMALPRRP